MPDDLFVGQAHARNSDPEPSHEAAAAITPGLRDLQQLVERFAIGKPQGFMDLELCRWREDLGESTLRTRRAELVARNIILDSGRRIRPGGKVAHTVWIHRKFVPDAPDVREPPKPASSEDKAKALDMAANLDREAASCRRQGLTAFSDFLSDCAQMMRALAV